jgi:hypothetical protein
VVNKRASDSQKQKIRKAFNLFDEVRLTTQAAPSGTELKPALLHISDVRKILQEMGGSGETD